MKKIYLFTFIILILNNSLFAIDNYNGPICGIKVDSLNKKNTSKYMIGKPTFKTFYDYENMKLEGYKLVYKKECKQDSVD